MTQNFCKPYIPILKDPVDKNNLTKEINYLKSKINSIKLMIKKNKEGSYAKGVQGASGSKYTLDQLEEMLLNAQNMLAQKRHDLNPELDDWKNFKKRMILENII